jgi:hypothetical protein
MVIRHTLVVALALTAACDSKKSGGGNTAKEERPAPFEIKVNKVERLEVVAPNKTYLEQGLGKKPPAGKIFVCVQSTVTSKSDQPESLPGPILVDGKGTKVEVSMTAAGSYLPEDWPADTKPAKIDPGASLKRNDCFEVTTDATTGMAVSYVDTGWGPKFKPWRTTVTL